MKLGASKEEIHQAWRIKVRITSFVFVLLGLFVVVSSGGSVRVVATIDLVLGIMLFAISAAIWFGGMKIIDYIDSKQNPKD